MSDEKPSPGPWAVDARGVLIDARGEELALIGWGTSADARLIVSAPEMLALLRDLEWCGDGAIECPTCGGTDPSVSPGEDAGHAPDCDFRALLNRIEGKP